MMATVNGTRIAYTDEGRGFPLMFLHGFPFHREVWSKQVEAFKSQFRVIVPDLTGSGESEASFGPTSLHHFSRDLHSLMEHLVTGPVVMAGQAMGGLVALAYAHAFPRLVRGLVLVGMKAVWNLPMAGLMSSSIGTDRDGARPHRWNTEASWGMAAQANLVEPTSLEQLLETLRVPTLVIAGAEDLGIGQSLDQAHHTCGAQFKLIPHAGELVAFEQADAFNQIVRNWLAWGSRGLKDVNPKN